MYRIFFPFFISAIRCEKACSKKDECFDIRQWYTCKHYQCVITSSTINRCIKCGVDTLREIPADEIIDMLCETVKERNYAANQLVKYGRKIAKLNERKLAKLNQQINL
jgi:hypothetical protein